MLRKRDGQKGQIGQIGSGLPFEDFDVAYDKPDVVMANLENLRPMIRDIGDMAQMPGWTKYIEPFLEKRMNPSRVIEMVKKGEDARFEVAHIEALGSLLNLVKSMVRTRESMNRLEAAKSKDEEN